MTSVPPSYQHPGSPPSRPELPDGVVAPEPQDMPPVGVPVWAPFAVMLASLVAVLIVQIFVVTGFDLAGADASRAGSSDEATMGYTLVLDLTLIGFAVITVMRLTGRASPATFGLRLPRWGPALGWSLAAYGLFILAAVLVTVVFGEADEQDIVTDLKSEDSVAILAGFAVMTCLLAPLAEEFFFRGFLFRVLRERVNVPVAVVAGGICFGLVHLPSGDWIGTIALSFFGMALCGLFLLTSSLLPCIMLHAFHNSISFGFTKELPWWGFLLLTVGSVLVTLAIALLATRIRPAPA